MSQTPESDRRFSDEELQDLVASTDSGGREPTNRKVALLIASVAFLWSAFQVWIADLQFQFAQYIPGARVIGSDQTRPMHLAFALFLAFLAYPAFKKSPRRHIPILDWIMAIVAGGLRVLCAVVRARDFGYRARRSAHAGANLGGCCRRCADAGSLAPRAWPCADHRWRYLSGLQLFRFRLADPRPDRA